MDIWSEVPSAYVWVEEGALYADTGWIVTTNKGTGLTLNGAGATIQWVLYASAGALIAGNGLTKTGNTIDIASTTLSVTANAVDLASIGQSNSTGTDGISFVQSHSVDSYGRVTGTISASVRLASITQTGIAKFDTSSFAVDVAGNVTIKAGGVTNTQLVNSSITIGTTSVGLGGSAGVSGSPIGNLYVNNVYTSTLVNGAATITVPGSTATLATLTLTETFTNKTISGASNTITNIANSSLVNSTVNFTAGTGITLSSTAASLGGTALTITNAGVVSITGTANQVIASASTGAVTLSLPQNIHTGATPTFAGANFAAGVDTVGVTTVTLTETWNNGAVSFLGKLINVTDTASAAGSRFVEYQIGGIAKFSVRKDGAITTGIWNASTIAAQYGGTGQSSYTQGDLLWASATGSTLAKLGIGATVGNQLTITAAGTLGYSATNLGNVGGSFVTGTLAIGNGGTGGTTAPTAGQFLAATSTSAFAPRSFTNGTGITITSDASATTIGVSSAVLQAANFVPYEIPTGTVNGVNTDFVLANAPVTGSGGLSTLQVFVAGVRMQPNSNDYAMFNSTTIRFQAGAIPQPGDVVSVLYFK
jgi:hypothetical protein